MQTAKVHLRSHTHYAGFWILTTGRSFGWGFWRLFPAFSHYCNGLICRDERGTVKTDTATRSCGNLTRFPILPYPYHLGSGPDEGTCNVRIYLRQRYYHNAKKCANIAINDIIKKFW